MEKRKKYRESIGRTTVPPGNLAEQVQYGKPVTNMPMWRTPDAAAGGSNLPGIKKALDEGHLKRPSGQQIQIRLQDQVKEPRLWPTPRASKAMSEKTSNIQARGTDRGKLEERVAMWPTPTANEDAAGRPGAKMQKMLGNHPEVRKPLDGGTLNPNWVEWLMGYQTGHTDLKR